jgi:tetratricopeptide (TPR) repeat protein
MRSINPRIVLSRRQAVFASLAAGGAALAIGLRLRSNELEPAQQQLEQAAGQRPISQNDQVLWSYQDVARQQPNNADARAILAAAYIQKARETGDPSYYAKAEEVIDQALRIAPDHIDALIAQGLLALARHQFQDALAIGEQARQLAPLVVAVDGVIADAQIELGMYTAAAATIQAMVNKRPDLASYSRVSYMRELEGDLPGAIDAMARAVQAGGTAVENVEWVRTQLGNLYFNSGNLVAAEQEYQTSLLRSPDYVFALAGMARILTARGELNAAIASYQQAIARMPLPEFVIGLGELLEASGQTEAAEQQYQLVRAMQQLFKANGVDTDLELAHFEADHGQQPDLAVTMAREAFQRQPNIKGADTLAWALYKQGNAGEAEQYAIQALSLGTRDSMLLFHAGMIAVANDKPTQARQYLNQAVALNPSFSPLYAPQVYATLASLAAS